MTAVKTLLFFAGFFLILSSATQVIEAVRVCPKSIPEIVAMLNLRDERFVSS